VRDREDQSARSEGAESGGLWQKGAGDARVEKSDRQNLSISYIENVADSNPLLRLSTQRFVERGAKTTDLARNGRWQSVGYPTRTTPLE
jgi:hypothetical protein